MAVLSTGFSPIPLMIHEKKQKEDSILFDLLPLGGPGKWRLQLGVHVGSGEWVLLVP